MQVQAQVITEAVFTRLDQHAARFAQTLLIGYFELEAHLQFLQII